MDGRLQEAAGGWTLRRLTDATDVANTSPAMVSVGKFSCPKNGRRRYPASDPNAYHDQQSTGISLPI
jgi:hypothetical protein